MVYNGARTVDRNASMSQKETLYLILGHTVLFHDKKVTMCSRNSILILKLMTEFFLMTVTFILLGQKIPSNAYSHSIYKSKLLAHVDCFAEPVIPRPYG